jgi:hypothetical protein
MEAMSEALREDDARAMSEGLRERLLAASADAGADRENVSVWVPPAWRRPTVWVGAAALAIVCAILYPVLSQSRWTARTYPMGKGVRMSAARETPGMYFAYPGLPDSAPGESTGPTANVTLPGGGWAADATPQRQVRRAASICVQVQDLEARSDEVEQMARKAGGFVANSALATDDDGLRAATITIRVPVGEFDGVLGRIAKLGTVTRKNVTGEDITEQVSDEAQAVRVLTEEIRSAEARIRRGQGTPGLDGTRQLRIRKAQAEARLALLTKHARLAAIEVELNERARTQIQGGWIEDIRDAGRSALNGFLAAARLPFLVVIWTLAYAPIWVPLLFAYRWAAWNQRRWADSRRMREWRNAKSPTAG